MEPHPIRNEASTEVKSFRNDETAALKIVIAGVVIVATGALAWFLAGAGLVAAGDVEGMPKAVAAIGWALVIGVPLLLIGAWLMKARSTT